jgi:aryl-alcohol dehydrogenase-like predicted oxidoreductase
MKTQSIPHTSLTPSILCLGTDNLGGTVDRDTSFALLDAFMEAGGTFIDTAKIYADWLPGEKSSSEKTVGRWMKSRGCRDRMVLATKGAHPNLDSMSSQRLSRADISSDLEASLEHLQTDRIDLYWLHRDDPNRAVDEILETLEDQVKAGKIRYYGCSNWQPERICAAREAAAAHGWQGFSGDQPMWSLAKVAHGDITDPTLAVMDDALWQYHRESGMACMPYSSMANGFFHKLERDQAGRLSPNQRKMFLTSENQARYERLQTLKVQAGLNATQVMLGFLYSQPFPVFPIVGPKTLQQLQDNLSAAETCLTAEQVDFLTR